MSQPAARLPRGLGGGSRTRILEELATAPLGVAELARRLGLSYMGAKAQCLALESAGFLETTRLRKPRGRPEVIYHLAGKSRKIFQGLEAELLLSLFEQAEILFGTQAAKKILFLHFRAMAERWAAELSCSDPMEKVAELVALRAAKGHFVRFEAGPPARMVETHHPLAEVFSKYQEAWTYETEALSLALGCPLRRTQTDKETHYVLDGFSNHAG